MIRLLHFSDVHVQDPVWSMPMRELMSKRLVGAVNLWLRRERLFRAVPAKIDALDRFRKENAVDAVLCSGDFTALGTEGEHRAARAAMQRFLDAPAGLALVPGNHDLYVRGNLEHTRFGRHFGDLLTTDRPEHAVDGPYPFVRLIGDDVAIVGLNSARPNLMPFVSSGVVPPHQTQQLVKILDEFRDRLCVVMTHYAPLTKAGRPDAPHHGLDNAVELLAICTRPNVVLIHGHIHHRYCLQATDARPWLFCAGSATHQGREGLWMYEIEGQHVRATPGCFRDTRYHLEPEQAVQFDWGQS